MLCTIVGGLAASLHAEISGSTISRIAKNKFSLIDLRFTKCLEHFIGVLIDIYLIKNFGYSSILVDKKSLPGYAHILFPVHGFLAPHSVFFDYFMVGVGNKVELQIVFRAKLLMSLLVIDGDAKQLDILLFEFVVRITERACFLRSARSVVFRIEEQHYALAFEVGESHGLAILIF